ncbi:p25-alpha family [Micractinium conductrix]|uniref:P25-alpha family n=1 Tax=Micractinium conductrix TaxID=554055 RepID=A0A2P6VRB3_9CHLO|nr:p25-alpha family [Micractinium conductrix]|eukprot:PSC76607.1 p25-alpha family [Micractinium conductrix]
MTGDLRSVFEAFAQFGSREPAGGMEGRAFSKLFKDCGLFCKRFTPTDADLVFSSLKPRGGKRISFEAFETALEKVATKKQLTVAELAGKIVAAGGPKASGTKAQANRFYDDKSSWTTTAKNGGPCKSDGQKTLAGLCDRSPADARGVSSGASNRAH